MDNRLIIFSALVAGAVLDVGDRRVVDQHEHRRVRVPEPLEEVEHPRLVGVLRGHQAKARGADPEPRGDVARHRHQRARDREHQQRAPQRHRDDAGEDPCSERHSHRGGLAIPGWDLPRSPFPGCDVQHTTA